MNSISAALQTLFSADSELVQTIGVTLVMSFFSTSISALIGIPLGILVGCHEFRGKRALLRIVHTLMGVPPVVAGLVVFMLLSRRGILGRWQLLFTLSAMVIAQVLLITPIIIALTASSAAGRAKALLETTAGLGLGRGKELLLMLNECRLQLISVVLIGFGRSIAEVGAVAMVGGNIAKKTRVMTTAILLETNKGNFSYAISLGVVLLVIAFVVNSLAQWLSEDSYV